MRKTILVMAAFVGMIIISFAFTSADQPRFKNLKVLPKNTTKQELDSIMKHFSMSLGVRCNFCHVRLNDEQKNWDFASDDNKNKNVARSMMRMTNKINKKYFKDDRDREEHKDMLQEVTCYTCHHGQEHPANKGTMMPQNRPEGPRNMSDSARTKQ